MLMMDDKQGPAGPFVARYLTAASRWSGTTAPLRRPDRRSRTSRPQFAHGVSPHPHAASTPA